MSVKEKELQIKENDLEAKSAINASDELFAKPMADIVDGLLKNANGDEELALKRINSYIDGAGDGLMNKDSVNAAKKELEKKVEAKMEAKGSELYNVLSEYFTEAYDTMFEDDVMTPKEKNLPYYKAIDYLIEKGINPNWQIIRPRPALYFEPYDKIMSLDKVDDSGILKMLVWQNGSIVGVYDDEGKFIPKVEKITTDEFKDALEDPRNVKVVDEFNKHYYDLDTIIEIIANGDELYNAWIERFFNEHKEELDLKKAHSWKTHKAFKQFWEELSNYEKSKYAEPMGVIDPWGLATKDPRKGMPISKIRMKKSPTRLNGKTVTVPNDDEAIQSGKYEPRDLSSDEKRFYLSDKELIKHWLIELSSKPEYAKYADEELEDVSGAKWKIIKAIETHNNTNPVKFQLEFVGNPEFKIIQTPGDLGKMIQNTQKHEKEESIDEAYGRFGSKLAQPTIDDYNSVYSYLEVNGIDPKFCRGARLYGDLGQEWRIVGYNTSDPEKPMLALQSFERPDEGIGTPSKVMSHKVPLEVVKKWAEKPKNQASQIEWNNIMLDPFQRQKAKKAAPDPDRKPMEIKHFDKVSARAKHGVM